MNRLIVVANGHNMESMMAVTMAALPYPASRLMEKGFGRIVLVFPDEINKHRLDG